MSTNPIPHRGVPVLNTNPAQGNGQQDPTKAIMNQPWYLFFQSLISGSSGGDSSTQVWDPLTGNPITY